MKSPPVIVIQLVHIEGPLKGEIQEFTDPVVSIGRHPSSQVCFPKKQTAISRNHAEIVREGNRFRLVDKSTNGTFVNGKRVDEAYLKDGDVLVFAEGGPKVSFLTNVSDAPAFETDVAYEEAPAPLNTPVAPSPVPDVGHGSPIPPAAPASPSIPPVENSQQPSPSSSVPPAAPGVDMGIQRAQVPLVIQFGPTLQSFKELPVSIGKNPSCAFVLEHPSILDRHAQVFFLQGQYWIKDLTGQNLLSINDRPVQVQGPLNPDDEIALSPQGPRFRFLGGGRLAEIEAPLMEQAPPSRPEQEADSVENKSESKGLKGAKAIFEKFLRK